jgi:urate oxidase
MPEVVNSQDYGKLDITFFAVNREGPLSDPREITVSVLFEGEFAAAYSEGDNESVLPAGSMVNTVFSLASDHPGQSIEELGKALAERFLVSCPALRRATVRLTETPWTRLEQSGRPDATGFVGAGGESATAVVSAERDGGTHVTSGVAGLRLLKTSGTQFTGFHHDEFTDLSDVSDRLTSMSFDLGWEFDQGQADYPACRAAARAATLLAFSRHHSLSSQHTMYVLGTAALDAVPELRRVHVTYTAQNAVVVDLSAFGRSNPGRVYDTSDRSYGQLHLTVERETPDGS